jgi:O-antigen/teichoic acid export membrane protein
MSLKNNTLWNLLGSGLPLLLGAVTIPYLLRNVGVEAFGILTLIWALIGYFSIFDFGLGRALTQQVASARASGQVGELTSLVKTGLMFIFLTGMLGGFSLAILANPLGYKWLNITVPLQQETVYSLLIAAPSIPIITVTIGLKGLLEAYEDFKSVNLLRLLLGLANFGLPVLSIMMLGQSLFFMVLSLIIARIGIFGAHLYLVHKRIQICWMRGNFSMQKMKVLLSFGVWMTVSNIVGPLMVVADRFIISSILGASLIAYYTVPSDFLIRLLIVPGALAAALFPRLTSMMAIDREKAWHVYDKSLKLTVVTMLPICLGIAIGSYWGITFWLGLDFAQESWRIASILAVGLFLNGVAQIPFAAVQAAGRAQATAVLHLGEFVFYIGLLLLLLHFFGLIGAAIGWVIRVGADLSFLLIFAKKYRYEETVCPPQSLESEGLTIMINK